MATVSKWTPFGVALDITATGSTVTRTSATKFTVKISSSWETFYSGAQTNYGMTATSGGVSANLNTFGVKSSGGSKSFTGTYSISGNGAATKTITVTFKNFNNDNGNSATKTVSFNVSVPAWTSYKVAYNANGGSGAPGSQTKWKDQTLTLSSTKPTRSNYSFQGWGTSASDTTVDYAAGASYKANAAITLYAIWKPDTYTIKYNANGGTGAPGSQTKTYGVKLTLSSTKPTRSNYSFQGWGTSASDTSVDYAAGAGYTKNEAATLYAIWELDYKKPIIKYLTAERCDSTGKESDDGKYVAVGFDWDTWRTVTKITIEVSSSSGTVTTKTVTASGQSGTVDEVVGSNSLSNETTYTVKVTVTDSLGSTSSTKTVSGLILPFDAKNGGTGVAFGKTAELDGYADFNYKTRFRNQVEFDNNMAIYGKHPTDGSLIEVIKPINSNGNLVIGYGGYSSQKGQTNIYGRNIYLGVSDTSDNTGVFFKPYYSHIDGEISIDIRTAGFVTSSMKEVYFVVPLSKPIISNPTITARSNSGFVLRQNNKYTHGSSWDSSTNSYNWATVSSYKKPELTPGGLVITAIMNSTTDAVNNSPISVHWSGYIKFD